MGPIEANGSWNLNLSWLNIVIVMLERKSPAENYNQPPY
jgi:hypothetical protein